MNKKILTSFTSVVLCAVIGFLWAYFLLNIGAEIFDNIFEDYSFGSAVLFLIASTFAAVSIIYCIAERGGERLGFSENEFLVWFCVVPLIFCFAANTVCSLLCVYVLTAVFLYEKTAYIMILIFCIIRLGIRRLKSLCVKSERNDNSDVYNSES